MKRYSVIAISAALFAAIMLAVSPRSQWPMTAVVTVTMIAVIGGLMTARVRRTAVTRKPLFLWAGGVALILGVGVLAASLTLPSVISPEVGAGVFCALLPVGILLLRMPSLSAVTERAVAAQARFKAAGPIGSDRISGVAEAIGALSDPINRWPAFVRVVGPWFAIVCALPLCLDWLAVTAKPAALDRTQAVGTLVAFLGFILAGGLILVIAAIQWTRFVATDHRPRWASIPARALWGWAWRLGIVGSVLRVTDGIDPWIARSLPGVETLARRGLSDVVFYGLAVLGTPLALSLTASALGTSSRTTEIRLSVSRAAGGSIYAGAAVVLAPVFLIAWLDDAVSARLRAPLAQNLGSLVYVITLFLTVTVFAGYLGRLYAKAARVG